jgi:hypothetical protein
MKWDFKSSVWELSFCCILLYLILLAELLMPFKVIVGHIVKFVMLDIEEDNEIDIIIRFL